jgi:glycosyltransferase involved in cell wall biosynthesis
MTQEPRRPVVVLHVFGRMNRGGAESRTMEVMRRLDPARHQLLFCALSGQRGDFDEEIRHLGGEVYCCRLGTTFPLRFIRLLRHVRPDIVHSHVHLASGFILLLARLAGIRGRIAHFRSTGDARSDAAGRRLYRRLMRLLISTNATRILAVSDAAMTAAMTAHWRDDARRRVVPNGIDVGTLTLAAPYSREELGVPDGARVIVSVGRDSPAKNRPRVLSVFAAIAHARSEVALLFVGRDEPVSRATLEEAAEDLGVADRVHFLGQRDDVPRILASADLMLAPSIREGSPGAILEASVLGVPVVASDIASIAEVADHIHSVHVLPLSASDDVWASQASALLDSSLDRSTSSNDAIGLRRYSLDNAVQTFIQEWDMLAGPAR